MGGGTFDSKSYATFSNSTRGKATDEIYTSKTINNTLNPLGVKIRESRDSADNPNSTPIIVALDVTGSMGMIADNIAREGLGILFNGILERKPISDPHIMFMGIGDVAAGDRAPLQVSQFEADNRIVEQLTQLYLEHGGGGNNSESYHFPWYFAAFHTEHDSILKRGKRGYLFTVGDECTPPPLEKAHIKAVLGEDAERDFTAEELRDLAQRNYNLFHVVIAQGDHARTYPDRVRDTWNKLLGQHVIWLDDYTKLAETIVSAIEVAEGHDAEASAGGWGTGTAAIVHSAVKHLPRGNNPKLLGAS